MLIKNAGFWVVVYAFAVSIALVWVSISYSNHKCPEPIVPEMTKENIEKIKEISNADTKNDLDSLLLELYGFESN